MTRKFLSGLLFLSTALFLGACEKTKEQFDFSKKAPDEFAVIKRAPLEMPPDFSLPAPKPGAPRPQEPSATDIARGAILGEDATRKVAQESGVSEGEAVLLQKTGAANAPSNIRAVVDKETAEIAEEESPGINKIKKLIGQKTESPSKVVDPVAEINRIKANKAAGKPINTGKTPVLGE